MKQKLREFLKSKKLIEITIILLVGLIILKWFGGQFLINGGDFAFPLNHENFFTITSNVWDSYSSTGASSPRNVAALMPFSILLLIFGKLGFSIYFTEKLLFYFWFVSAGISTYILCSVLGINKYGRLFSSLFYMINPFSLIVIYHVAHGLLFPIYAFLPLLLALFIYGLKNNKNLIYIILINLLFLATITNNFVNPALFIVSMIPLFVYALYQIATNFKKKQVLKKSIKFILMFFIVMSLFNIYWIIPSLTSVTEQHDQASNTVELKNKGPFLEDKNTFKLNSGKIHDLFRMMGLWSTFANANKEDTYYSWTKYYKNNFFIILTYLIPLLLIIPFLFFKKSNRENIIFLGLLFLIAIFLNKGHNLPFLKLTSLLFERISIVTRLFRGVILKFGFLLALSISPLLGEGIGTLVEIIQKKKKTYSTVFLSLMLFLFIFVMGFPAWTGSVIQQPQKYYPGLRLKIPLDYYSFESWDANQTDSFRYYVLPLPVSYNVVYWWGDSGYIGGEFMRWFTKHPLIDVNTGEYYSIPETVAKKMNVLDCSEFELKLLGKMNVKYLLYHKDTDWVFLDLAPDSFFMKSGYVMDSCLRKFNLSLAFTSENLDVYELPAEFVKPKIYGTNIINTIENATFINTLNQSGELQDFVLLDQLENNITSNAELSQVDFEMISPVKYEVTIKNTNSSKTILVFSETFNPNWKLYLTNKSERMSWVKLLFAESVPEKNHFTINSFANAWEIDTAKFCKDTEECVISGVIYFKSQTKFYIGLIVSILSVSSGIILVVLKKGLFKKIFSVLE